MGTTKKELFSKGQNELSAIAKAMGHPARIAIIHHIISAKECINGDLVQELGLAQATISQHLKELKAVGIIKGTTEGVSICYCIDHDKWKEIKNLFNELFNLHVSCAEENCG